MRLRACVRACARVCVRACVCARARVCVGEGMRAYACVHACVRARYFFGYLLLPTTQ